MDISFKFDPEVLVGADTFSMAGTVTSRHGQRVMVVANQVLDKQNVNRLKEILEDSRLEVIVFDGVENSSQVQLADNIVELSNAAHCDAIIGFGGYKTQVIARMAAIMAPMKITAFELLDGRIVRNKFLPFISIPTEGTNAFSFTEFFVAADPRSRLLKSIHSPGLLNSSVIIDSSLFKFASDNAGPGSGAYIFDGLMTALEAYCSAKANFLSDPLLERSLTLFAKIIKAGINAQGLTDSFAQASFLASVGSSLTSPGIGAALSAAIDARTPIPRQLCSSALFPPIAQRLVSSRPEKMARFASLMGVPKSAAVADAASAAVEAIHRNMATFNVPTSLKKYNVSLDRMTAAAEAARNMDFVTNSPWLVSEEEVFSILKEIF